MVSFPKKPRRPSSPSNASGHSNRRDMEITPIKIHDLKELLISLLSTKTLFEYCIFIWGPPGIGKTALMQQVTDELNLSLNVLMLNQLEPSDIKGLPVVDQESKEVRYLKDRLIPRDPDQRGILFLDEITTASIEVAQASLRMIHERRIDDLELPPGMLIVAAGNRRSDGAFTNVISSAMAGRFLHFEMVSDLEQWCDWASEGELNPEIISFLRQHPRLLHDMSGDLEKGWPSPRSWEMLSKVLKDLGGLEKIKPSLLRALTTGAVGLEAGALFLDHIDTKRFWLSPKQFFEELDTPILIDDSRPDLRVKLLEEMTQAFIDKVRVFYVTDEVKRRWVDGLFCRLTALSDTEVVLMIRQIAQAIKTRDHRLITSHERFAELVERLGLEALQCLRINGQELTVLAEKGFLNERGRGLLETILGVELGELQ